MAVVNYVETVDDNLIVVEWSSMANLDTGQPYFPGFSSDRSVQVEGTFGGASVAIEGSNYLHLAAAPTFRTLNDPGLNALNMGAVAIKQILEVTNQIRPNVTGGGGGTILNVKMLFHRTLTHRVVRQ